MSLKDGIESVKQELSSDEKLLEQAFHLERFLKKHKIKIIATVAVLILAFAGYKINSYIKEQKLIKANEALLVLEKNPNNKEALKQLKDNNPKLYTLFEYSNAVDNENFKALDSLKTDDKLLSDVINYHKAVLQNKTTNSEYYTNLVLVEKAYLLIKEGKKDAAKNLLMQVPKNSAVAPVARLLEHYTIK